MTIDIVKNELHDDEAAKWQQESEDEEGMYTTILPNSIRLESEDPKTFFITRGQMKDIVIRDLSEDHVFRVDDTESESPEYSFRKKDRDTIIITRHSEYSFDFECSSDLSEDIGRLYLEKLIVQTCLLNYVELQEQTCRGGIALDYSFVVKGKLLSDAVAKADKLLAEIDRRRIVFGERSPKYDLEW